MELSLEEKRHIASLVTVKGYQILLEKVVQLNKDATLAKMKLALSDEKLQYAYEFCAWDTVYKTLKGMPEETMEALKAENDEVYGGS